MKSVWSNMIIKVKGYASMRQYTAHLPSDGDLEIPEGAKVCDVLEQLKVPPELKKLIMVNGHHEPPQHILEPEDLLVFFPPLEGG